jgi:cytochrome c biogenesis protein CcmG/thiol:disulfide interchange protein DsbE
MSDIMHEPQLFPEVEEVNLHSWKRTIGAVVSFGFVLALLGILGWGLINVQRGSIQDGMAPDFSLTSFEEETLTLSEMRGQVVIINFWASWCPP